MIQPQSYCWFIMLDIPQLFMNVSFSVFLPINFHNRGNMQKITQDRIAGTGSLIYRY